MSLRKRCCARAFLAVPVPRRGTAVVPRSVRSAVPFRGFTTAQQQQTPRRNSPQWQRMMMQKQQQRHEQSVTCCSLSSSRLLNNNKDAPSLMAPRYHVTSTKEKRRNRSFRRRRKERGSAAAAARDDDEDDDDESMPFRYKVYQDIPEQRRAAWKLLETPAGSMTTEMWLEAREVVPFWATQRTAESVRLSFALLDKLLLQEEEQHVLHGGISSSSEERINSEYNIIIPLTTDEDSDDNKRCSWLRTDAELLNRMVNNWRVVSWNNDIINDSTEEHSGTGSGSGSSTSTSSLFAFHPAAMVDRVAYYQERFQLMPTEKTYYLILEAAMTRYGQQSTKSSSQQEQEQEQEPDGDPKNDHSLISSAEDVVMDMNNTASSSLSSSSSVPTDGHDDDDDCSSSNGAVRAARQRQWRQHEQLTAHTLPEFAGDLLDRCWDLHDSSSNNNNDNQRTGGAMAAAAAAATSVSSSDYHHRPSTTFYNLVMSSWIHSGRPPKEIAAETELLLETMLEQCVPLNRATYHRVMKAWLMVQQQDKSGSARGAVRCQELLHRMYREYRAGDKRVRPFGVAFVTALQAWAHSKSPAAPAAAEELLSLMETGRRDGTIALPASEESQRVAEVFALNAYIACLCNTVSAKNRSRRDNATALNKARRVLDRLRQSTRYSPNYESYTFMIHGYSAAGDAVAAEELLKDMYLQYNANAQENRNLLPRVETVTSVITAWSRSQSPYKFERAKAIFDKYQELSSSSRYTSSTSSRSNASSSDVEENAAKGEDEEEVEAEKGPYDSSSSSSSILRSFDAYSQEEEEDEDEEEIDDEFYDEDHYYNDGKDIYDYMIDSAVRHDNIKDDLHDDDDGHHHHHDGGGGPNTVTYNALLACLAHSRVGYPAQKAQEMLEEMKRLSKQQRGGEGEGAGGGSNVRPDRVTYTTVMSCWANGGFADRAEDVLRDMYRDYREGNVAAKPDLRAFNTVLVAYANSNDRRAPYKAEQLIKRMIGSAIPPDVYSYSSAISCWARAKHEDRRRAANRAEQLLRQMKQQHESSGSAAAAAVRPNKVCYNNVMNAWALEHDPVAVERILREMHSDYMFRGNVSAEPTVSSFNILLKALAYSKNPAAPEKAEEIVLQMRDWHNRKHHFNHHHHRTDNAEERQQHQHQHQHSSSTGSGSSGNVTPSLDVAPNMVSYTTLMLCHGLAKLPGGPQRCEEILRHMQSLYDAGELDQKPNIRTWRTLRKAWLYSNEPGKEGRVAAIDREIHTRFGRRHREVVVRERQGEGGAETGKEAEKHSI